MSEDLHNEVMSAYKKKVLFTSHAMKQMNSSERMISREEVVETILEGQIIEEYLDDPRGKSCLLCCCTSSGRTIHVVCAPKDEYLAIITAYIPVPFKWGNEARVRRK